jgi:hypothetical protein
LRSLFADVPQPLTEQRALLIKQVGVVVALLQLQIQTLNPRADSSSSGTSGVGD